MSPNHRTVLVCCCRPPRRRAGDLDNDPPGRCRKTRMKMHRCCLNNAAPSPCCTKRVALCHHPLHCSPPPPAPPPTLHPPPLIPSPPFLPTLHLPLLHWDSLPSARSSTSAALVTRGPIPASPHDSTRRARCRCHRKKEDDDCRNHYDVRCIVGSSGGVGDAFGHRRSQGEAA